MFLPVTIFLWTKSTLFNAHWFFNTPDTNHKMWVSWSYSTIPESSFDSYRQRVRHWRETEGRMWQVKFQTKKRTVLTTVYSQVPLITLKHWYKLLNGAFHTNSSWNLLFQGYYVLFTSILVWKKGLSEDQFVLLLTPLTWLYGSIVDMSAYSKINIFRGWLLLLILYSFTTVCSNQVTGYLAQNWSWTRWNNESLLRCACDSVW